MERKNRFWTRTPVVVLFAFICCFLWGSAFPCIKTGYALFHVAAEDTASQLLFAGIRFFFAGLLVLLFGSILNRRPLKCKARNLPKVAGLAFFQTLGQYFFFYIGLAHATGVSSSVIESASTFFAVLIAGLIFRTEKITRRKMIGCLLGFVGVLLVHLKGASLTFSFTFLGEGFVLISALFSAFSSSFIKKWSADESPVALSGYQFVVGGAGLALMGFLMGGRMDFALAGAPGAVLLTYMAFISACAYTLWSLLLKYNPVSRVAVYGFMNPVIGVVLSALILGEFAQAFNLMSLGALILVSLGIIVVNGEKRS